MLFRNSSTTIPNDFFLNNDKADETSPAFNDDHISDDNDGTKDEDNNFNKKNTTVRKNKNKKKERKNQNTKDQNKEINSNTKHNDKKNIVTNSIQHNSTASTPKSK